MNNNIKIMTRKRNGSIAKKDQSTARPRPSRANMSSIWGLWWTHLGSEYIEMTCLLPALLSSVRETSSLGQIDYMLEVSSGSFYGSCTISLLGSALRFRFVLSSVMQWPLRASLQRTWQCYVLPRFNDFSDILVLASITLLYLSCL